MPQQPVEIILLRQWASYMSIPIWVMDARGDLLYYNRPAEEVLGREFDQAGPIQATEIATLFRTRRVDGTDLPNHELPVVVGLVERRPAHGPLSFQGLDGAWREIEVTALPIERPGGELLGVVAIFWEHQKT